ncbi:bifunctional UDP-sugar hydrolase/5'-nucleotidase [Pontibacillus sp. HMF3514]|uniref:bifunctional metallophosphatase/5'-nucleotidase n=1 Tax=Pontibacillus sp. HMF3514 TaxID=2692425 RepID=UPI0013202B94|nr:bifunctional UDP-sugar hydrolase/5'-nucleotidase [Pontibacillus sp. HMF3514]QHE53430.1 bifunctional metallophosphatase/5'-nucleotidase [Pontibacillus sp. HMF3514]
MQEKIYLYYTNDLHSHFENWPKIVQHWKHQRNYHEQKNETMFLLDVGDHVDRFHPISEAMKGSANIALLNDAGYDCATLGNNEGITLSHDELFHLYDEANFDVVCANLENAQREKPSWLKPYSFLTTDQGTRIGIIGLTAPFKAFYGLLGWNVYSPFQLLDDYLDEVRAQSDIVILLSHLGINDDQEIANRYSGIDVIIGGHTHHLFRDGEMVEGTLLTAAGKHGVYVGQVAIQWDHDRNELVQKEAYAYPLDNQEEDIETRQKLEQYNNQAADILKDVVVRLNEPLDVHWFQETKVIKELVYTLKEWTDADISMLNAGVLLEPFSEGPVTRGDIHKICPHPINPCKVTLTGSELLEVIRQAHTKRFMELKLKGFGFRGEVLGRMVFSGVEVETEKDQEGNEHVREVRFQGEPLDHKRTYTVATADTFTFGRLLPEISHSRDKYYFMPELLRDLLSSTLQRLSLK